LDKEWTPLKIFSFIFEKFFFALSALLGASKKFSNLQENLLQMSCIPYPKLALKKIFQLQDDGVIKCLLVLLILSLAACTGSAPNEVIRPVRAIQVEEPSTIISNQIVFPGTLRAFKRANLSFRVDGTIIKRDTSVGQKVKKDEILIQLDPRDYEVALKKAKGKAESIQAQLNFALRDYERMKNIYETDPGAISQSYLDRKLETTNQLQGELIVAEGEFEKAADDLSYTLLKSPFDGIITAIYVENHEQVRAKQSALRLVDISEAEMEINVPENHINTLITEGAKLKFQVILDVFPDKVFAASIKEIGTEAASTTQTYPVTLTIKDIPFEFSLLAGMSGKAILERPKSASESATHAFHVPKSAIFTDNLGRNFVWVIDPNSQMVHKKLVQLDEKNKNNFALIEEGVAVGDWIVTAGTSFLSEGQKVKLVVEQSGP